MTTFVSAYTMRAGRQTADKDPDDVDNWGVDFADVFAENSTATVVSVTALPTGVTCAPTAIQSGTWAYALFSGGDKLNKKPEANCCTFRLVLSNGVQRDRTIYFRMVDK